MSRGHFYFAQRGHYHFAVTILTGEYPPQKGGVADYTRAVAEGLSAAGEEVHVWAPVCTGGEADGSRVQVHRLPGNFGREARRILDRDLAATPGGILLVEYVPQAFGWRGANLPFCLWLYFRGRVPLWTLFHEVQTPFRRSGSARSHLLALATRTMAALVTKASDRIYLSTESWRPLLHFAKREPECLPPPSNLPIQVAGETRLARRAQLIPDPDAVLIGHFSSYSTLISPLLSRWIPELLAGDERRAAVLIGNRAGCYARDILRSHPRLKPRLLIAEDLPNEQAGACIAACDLMVQPYPDGVSTRRTTLMACLALGMPVVATHGPLTEPFWRESDALVLVDGEMGAVAAVDRLLPDPSALAALGARAAALYRARFSLERVVAKLRADATALT